VGPVLKKLRAILYKKGAGGSSSVNALLEKIVSKGLEVVEKRQDLNNWD